MKKIYFSLLLVLVGLVTSCDMNKEPYGSLVEDKAIQSMQDISRFRGGVYTSLRSMSTGSWVYYQDLQMDEFHGLVSNQNRNGDISAGTFNASTPEFASYWGGCYSVIAKANYLIREADKMKGNTLLPADSLVRIGQYKADGQFLRAYAYFFLAEHFCQAYTADNATKANAGLPIVTEYNPTGVVSAYPGRSTMEDTYKLIENDLNEAYTGLKAAEDAGLNPVRPMSAYLTSNAVLALQARIALYKGDYVTALAKAKQVIDGGTYALTAKADINVLWTSDISNEIIFRPFQSKAEKGGTTATPYESGDNNAAADYIPTFATLEMYGDAGDLRFQTYFSQWHLDVEGTRYLAYVLNKYPGNETLKTSQSKNYQNMGKPFRLSELYLIAAEAAYRTGNEVDANLYLNDLRKQRINNYTASQSTGTTLLSNIKSERKKELLGEGFRFYDLKRWQEGFTRYASHQENPNLNAIVRRDSRSVSYVVNDYRFTWPIPKEELDANPQIKGQQNPGY